MTDNDRRIAIAEYDGFEHWKASERPVVYLRRPTEATKKYWLSCGDTIRPDLPITQDVTTEVPDYLHDLNAMHAVEKNLKSNPDKRGWESYILLLDESLGSGDKIHATADQRAEALLKVIGKSK